MSVAPCHLFRYLDEQSFRYDERNEDDLSRFRMVLSQGMNRRLTYHQLIGANV